MSDDVADDFVGLRLGATGNEHALPEVPKLFDIGPAFASRWRHLSMLAHS